VSVVGIKHWSLHYALYLSEDCAAVVGICKLGLHVYII
jgi:hypothetical protein